MHWTAGPSEHASQLRMMSFVKIYVFQKGRAWRNNNNAQYVENNVFFNLKPHKRIALHQIKLFLAMSYDPFKHITDL